MVERDAAAPLVTANGARNGQPVNIIIAPKVMNRNGIGLGDNGLAAVPTGGEGGLIIR